jgi:predicted GNAT superfamily acetyltransferase
MGPRIQRSSGDLEGEAGAEWTGAQEPLWAGPELPVSSFSVILQGAAVRIDVRRLSEVDEYRECERLQERIWGPEDIGRASSLVLLTAQHNGGLALGAFAGHRLAGFVYSFLGLTPAGGFKHCSVLLAVDPQFHQAGIGYRLKLAQRQAVLAQGLDLITWTFDPLASINAFLNLRKLGCTSSVYLENYYGTPCGGLNAGLATDRLLAEWRIRAPRVEQRLRPVVEEPVTGGALVNEVVSHPRSGLPMNRQCRLECRDPMLLVEIPGDLRAIKALDMDLAHAWRMELREILSRYFASGYQVVDFFRREYAGRLRSCYVLRKGAA